MQIFKYSMNTAKTWVYVGVIVWVQTPLEMNALLL